MTKGGHVYILASGRNGTLYVGVTSNLQQRIDQHRAHAVSGFTEKHNVIHLVWCEYHDDIESAIQREKNIKKWKRQWKLRLIEETNSDWNDISDIAF